MAGKMRMAKLLTTDGYSVTKTTDVLARIWRSILRDLQVTPVEWERRIKAYLDTANDGKRLTGSKRSNTKGNLNSGLAADKLSWKVFCTGLRVLGSTQTTMELELSRLGRVTVHKFEGLAREQDDGVKLARIFKQIQYDLGIGPELWIVHMNAYLKTPSLGLPPKGGERSTEKGNIEARLTSDSMTMNIFFRGLTFFGVDELRIRFILGRDGENTVHHLRVTDFSDPVCFRRRFIEASKECNYNYEM